MKRGTSKEEIGQRIGSHSVREYGGLIERKQGNDRQKRGDSLSRRMKLIESRSRKEEPRRDNIP